MTKRTRMVAAAAGAGALAVGGFVVKRVIGHGDEDGPSADPIAETPTAPPGAEEKPVPKPKPAKPKAVAPKPAKPKPAPKPKAPKPDKAKGATKAAAAKPKAKPAPKPKAAAKPPKPKVEPGNMTGGKDPHHALNNPVGDPDPTEYPDPYETREDPRDPIDPDDAPFGEEPHPPTGAESTSEPPPAQDPELENGGKPPRRDKLDD